MSITAPLWDGVSYEVRPKLLELQLVLLNCCCCSRTSVFPVPPPGLWPVFTRSPPPSAPSLGLTSEQVWGGGVCSPTLNTLSLSQRSTSKIPFISTLMSFFSSNVARRWCYWHWHEAETVEKQTYIHRRASWWTVVGTPGSQQEGHCVAGSIPGRFVQSQTMMAGWMWHFVYLL